MQNLQFTTTKPKVDFYLGSDFHIEAFICKKFFDPSSVIPKIGKDPTHFNICLLAGDICVLKRMYRNKQFMAEFCKHFDLVFYIEGNHENYNGNLNHGFKKFREYCSDIDNLVFLQQETVIFKVNNQQFKIIGATLWGDLRNADQTMLFHATRTQKTAVSSNYYMTDFSKIRTEQSRYAYPMLSLHTYMLANKKDREFIIGELQSLSSDTINILMTHHSPIYAAIDKEDSYNAFEHSDLTDEIKSSRLNFSVFGHIHRGFGNVLDIGTNKFKTGECTCFSNPAGYYELSKEDSRYALETIFSCDI
ncbi:metallophosphoesterase [Photobacterium damselae]|uniref:metallophosphoesterase n=1 Tax=Photobacterium damselae TaxID=38293 RepID=UPI001F2DAADC|nr:metallophosphoesterase [Photobacterium damselae]UKA04846.1 metallophosphoesterase [Photobacterium damselae subsp. damselae]